MAAPGSLTSIGLEDVSDDELNAARAGREHGAYDTTVESFWNSGKRGSKVTFEGVQANSAKTSLSNAIARLSKRNGDVEIPVEVRIKGENVYLVRTDMQAESAEEAA